MSDDDVDSDHVPRRGGSMRFEWQRRGGTRHNKLARKLKGKSGN